MELLDEVTLADELEAALRSITELGGRVHNGSVPNAVETRGGFIRPYVVMFAGLAGDLPLEVCLAREVDRRVLNWNPQINCVGADPNQALGVAVAVKNKLTGLRIGNHWMKPDSDAFRINRPQLDTQVSPARFFLPVSMNLLTT